MNPTNETVKPGGDGPPRIPRVPPVIVEPPRPGDTDFLDALGEPFAGYGRALLAADEAEKRFHAAQVRGDVHARQLAELEYENAVAAIYRIKHHAATVLLVVVRWAAEVFPGALAAVL